MSASALAWEAQDVSDDHGRDGRRDLVHVAHDEQGCEWIVSPHDDGSWNWMRWDPAKNEPLACGTDLQTADAALEAANAYAARVLR